MEIAKRSGITHDNKGEVLALPASQIEELILYSFGIKAEVTKTEKVVAISVMNWNSVFEIMRKIRYDFDYDVLKRGKNYILCIPNN